MSTSTPITSGLSKLKVAELREKLEELGLSTAGTKPLLLARLKEALTNTPVKTGGEETSITRTDTPSRRSKRISESFSESLDPSIQNPLTPLKKMKKETSRPSTPVRRSRRLSGSLEAPTLENPPQEKPSIETIEEDAEEDTSEAKDKLTATESQPGQERGAIQDKSEEDNTKEKAEDEISKEGDTKAVEKKNLDTKDDAKAEDLDEKKENIPMLKKLDQLFTSKSIPRQKPKSGRFWKGERAQFRQIKRDRGQRPSFEQRLKIKDEKLRNKELADFMKNKKNQEKEELRKRIEENKARKLENERKTEQYQVVKNQAKIKRMKKKQLRMLEKRDILPVPK